MGKMEWKLGGKSSAKGAACTILDAVEQSMPAHALNYNGVSKQR